MCCIHVASLQYSFDSSRLSRSSPTYVNLAKSPRVTLNVSFRCTFPVRDCCLHKLPRLMGINGTERSTAEQDLWGRSTCQAEASHKVIAVCFEQPFAIEIRLDKNSSDGWRPSVPQASSLQLERTEVEPGSNTERCLIITRVRWQTLLVCFIYLFVGCHTDC